MLDVLIRPDGKRRSRLHHKTNEERLVLCDRQLVLRHNATDALLEARRFIGHYRSFVGRYPPYTELAAGFLAKLKNGKPNTLYRYCAIIQGFIGAHVETLEGAVFIENLRAF